MQDIGLEAGKDACSRFGGYAEKALVTTVDLLANIAGWLTDNGDPQGKRIGRTTLDELGKIADRIEKLPITEEGKKILESIACGKHQMDCSFEVDRTVKPPQHFVFFQAKDTETMTKAFKELATIMLRKEKSKIQNKGKSIENKMKDAHTRSKSKKQVKEKLNNRGEISK